MFETAIFAMGCFWCGEHDFDILSCPRDALKLPAIAGYTGGSLKYPTYEDYASGGHEEAVEFRYNEETASYGAVLFHFWTHIDPLDNYGQFCDRGQQYESAIYYTNDEQKKIATHSKGVVESVLGRIVQTEIRVNTTFWPAEGYHQQYWKKNPFWYQYYRSRCGRDDRLAELWTVKTKEKLMHAMGLTPHTVLPALCKDGKHGNNLFEETDISSTVSIISDHDNANLDVNAYLGRLLGSVSIVFILGTLLILTACCAGILRRSRVNTVDPATDDATSYQPVNT